MNLLYMYVFHISQDPEMVKLFDPHPTYSARTSHTLNLGYFDGFGQFSAYRNSEPFATVFHGDSLIMSHRW